MTTYFLDTNALVKLYAFDRTSYWTIGVVASRQASTPSHRRLRDRAGGSAIRALQARTHRRNYRGGADGPGGQAVQPRSARGCLFRRSRFSVVFLSAPLLARATQLLERYRTGKPKALHTLDALHLASALIARAMLPESERATFHFVSADKQLRGCAAAQGLAVIDPNHPPTSA